MLIAVSFAKPQSTTAVTNAARGDCVNNPLQLDPPSIVVRFGDPASVKCSTNFTHQGIGWEASQGGVDMITDVQSINWTVGNISHWDLKPFCFIHVNGQCVTELNITIYKPPDRVSISFVNHTGPMIEGKQYELQCEVQNVAPVRLLTVNWYKGQQLVKTDSFTDETKAPVSKTMTLQVSPQRGDDGVQYRCEAELELGPEGPQPPPKVKSALNITVHFGPEFSNCKDDEQLMEGESLVGYCTATGNPLPVYYWEKDKNIVDRNTPLNRTSNGKYNIIINNTTVRSVNVVVKYGPEISCEPIYTVEEGHDFMPNCTVVGFPKPELTWYKDNMDILQIPHKMTKKDSGQYILQASNGNAIVNHTLEVEVLYPPTDIVELKSAQVSHGEDVYLKCSSKGNPPISYIWTYHQTSNVQVVHQDGMSLLHIKHVNEENIGRYKCTAYNYLREKSHTVRVDIKGAKANCPLWISPQESVFPYTSATVTFTCNSSVPNAKLRWEYLNQTYHGSTLDINPASVVNLPAWNVKASCYGNFSFFDNCTKNISVSMYKLPDKMSISPVNHTGPMIEGHNFTLRCDILNVAPIQSLIVNWYEGKVLVESKRFPTTRNPDNKTLTLNISPKRNSALYTCEAKLDLGSNLTKLFKVNYNAEVYAIPVITTKFPARVPLFRGYPEKLVCEASGFPEPTITWSFNNKTNYGNQTVIDSPGDYTCTASNSFGTAKKKVIVDMKEDYLPLIAGFVALMVVIILVAFVIIYSIYYKNNKMGVYIVKGAKPNDQNGNIAQNGTDNTIPMKKIIV
ncbi:intercellular adhesion molecule 5 precursor [Silurus asotus]|uniref:Intercellular adhesion molecule 5 n=1 Tax=Silurus asotus TaxID=30991 RepID=A0AAD5A0J9_SILAS|nr:intercellular adhesion molecule 5 precursor [Silurus asotus]